jgi:hypothetical protein
MTLGSADFIRVPLPAARTTAANRDGFINGSRQFQKRDGGTIARRPSGYNTQIITKRSVTTFTGLFEPGGKPAGMHLGASDGLSDYERCTHSREAAN